MHIHEGEKWANKIEVHVIVYIVKYMVCLENIGRKSSVVLIC